jgi:hypothetical protein
MDSAFNDRQQNRAQNFVEPELPEAMSAAIFQSACAIQDDHPDDPDYAPIGKFKNPRAPAIRDIRDLSLDHLDDIHRKVIEDWFAQAALLPDVSYHAQVSDIASTLRAFEPAVTFASIGWIFGVKGGTISNHLKNSGWTLNPRGRPSLLSEKDVRMMTEFVMARFNEKNPATYADVWDFLEQ